MKTGCLTALMFWFVWSLPLQAQLLYEEDGLQLHGYKRIATKNAATCHVLEDAHSEAKFEQIKDNDGQPLHVWLIEITVRNATSKPLSFVRGDVDIVSPYPPCTNWTGQGPGNGATGGPYPGGVQWGRHSVTISSPHGMHPWQDLRETVFMAVFHTDEPSLERWSVNFTFGEPKEPVSPPSQTAPPEPFPTARGVPDPDPVTPVEPDLDGKPTCSDQPPGTAVCWLELSNRSGCYIWDTFSWGDSPHTWTGECALGLAQGKGQLRMAWKGRGGARTGGGYGSFQNGRKHGEWSYLICDEQELVIILEGSYKNGERHGRWAEHEKGDGFVSVSDYVNGQYQGGKFHDKRWVSRPCPLSKVVQ